MLNDRLRSIVGRPSQSDMSSSASALLVQPLLGAEERDQGGDSHAVDKEKGYTAPAKGGSPIDTFPEKARSDVIALRVGGMSCTHCVASVQRALEAVPGVTHASVDLQSGVALVSGAATSAALVEAVASSGKTAVVMGGQEAQPSAFSATTLRVEGMTCGHCVSSVQKALEAVPGAQRVNVDLESGVATVQGPAAPAALVEAVEAGGRNATLIYESRSPLSDASIAPIDQTSSNRVRLAIEGMTCPRCVASVKQALEAVPHAERVVVDLASASAEVHGAAKLGDLIAAVEATGKSASAASPSSNTTPKAPPRTRWLAVDGMTCNGCAEKVSRSLRGVEGVLSAEVDLDHHLSHVELSSAEVSDEALIAAVGQVKGHAYSASLISENSVNVSAFKARSRSVVDEGTTGSRMVVLALEGMSCAACSRKVETALASLSGVATVSVSLMANSGKVQYDDSRIDVKSLVDAVAKLGYKATPCGGAADGSNEIVPSGHLEEAKRWRRQMIGSLCLSIPVFFLSMVAPVTLLGPSLRAPAPLLPVISCRLLLILLCATPVQFWFGGRFYVNAFAALAHCATNMDTLVAIGTSVAYFYSLVAVIACILGVGGEAEDGMGDSMGVTMRNGEISVATCDDPQQFETAAVLISFILIGKFLEASAKGKASEAIEALLKLQPATALRVDCITDVDDAPVEIPANKLDKGDVVKILPGSQVPTDSTVLRGSSAINEAMITGEAMCAVPLVGCFKVPLVGCFKVSRGAYCDNFSSLMRLPPPPKGTLPPSPVAKKPGDLLIGGSINGPGVLWGLVTADESNGTLAQIMQIVSDAQHRKPSVQALADVISNYFVPSIITAALLTWLLWTIALHGGLISENNLPRDALLHPTLTAFSFGCAVLVVACPCALGLATPAAVMVGSGVSAAHGILFKGGDVLERAGRLGTILFDKTGTLTTGSLQLCHAVALSDTMTTERLVRLAASAERGSEHPIAIAINKYAEAIGVPTVEPSESSATAGLGLRCTVEGEIVVLGNSALMSELGVELTAQQAELCVGYEEQGHTVVLLGIQESSNTPPILVGMLSLSDTVRPESRLVVQQLRRWGIDVWMVTGDNERASRAVATSLSIPPENVVAGVLPAGKLEVVRRLQSSSRDRAVAFVGDGVNDAPALAQADVGFGVGSGTAVAIETADVVLMKDSLADVAIAVDLARTVMARIRLNFCWAFGYNLLGVPLAAGLLYPPFGIELPPMFAGAAMALSSVSVICSSLLLRCYSAPHAFSVRSRQVIAPAKE